MAEGWTDCEECGGRFKWDDTAYHKHRTKCIKCVEFIIDLGPMDWRLFQRQRHVLLRLTEDDRLDDLEQEYLTGLLHLTDHIHDTAKVMGRNIPSLDEIVLDLMADV